MGWDDRTPVEQALIGYCVPRGIRLSEFRDLWSDEDRQAVYDWLEQQARCEGCGQPLGESMAKENSFAYKAEGVRCHGCYARVVAEAKAEGGKPAKTAGWRWRITKVGADGHVD